MKTVDELVSEWTEEEKGKLADLIDECRERERALRENSRICRENLNRLNGLLLSLSASMNELQERGAGLRDDLWDIYLRLYKKEMPSS